MVREPGTSNCPSCDSVVASAVAVCPTCGFRLVATTDAQVVLGLLRGGGPAPAPYAPSEYAPTEYAPTERIPLDQLAAPTPAGVPAGAPQGHGTGHSTGHGTGYGPGYGPPPGPDGLAVDSLFVRPPAGPPAPVVPPAPVAGDGRPGLLERLGKLPLPDLLAGNRRPGDGRSSRMPLLIALGLVALILAGATFAIAGLAGSLTSQTRKQPAEPAAPVVVTLVPVDPAGITAKASSTLHPESRGYQARNTLDGRENTAWNSDGDKVGRGVGVTLRWTFDQEYDIRRLTLQNGYVRSSKDPQVFENNGRIKRVKVTADGASTELTLKDTPSAQTLPVELGATRSVTFEVLEVYPGAKYKDLALTDIRFDAAG